MCDLQKSEKEKTAMKKKSIVFVVISFMLLMFIWGCGSNSEKPEKYIGIISAMDNEIDILLKEAKIDHVDKVAKAEYHVGTLHGQPVVITRAGIGKVRSSSGVTTMLNNYKISKVIFTGIAGGVADKTKVLDEVIATRLVEHDYGIVTNDGFKWRSGDPGVGDKEGEYYESDPKLVDLAYKASVEVVGKEHTHKGTIASGDQFIASEDYVKRLQKEYNAYACEMEGASVAVICGQYNTPFVVIRALSDKADGKAHKNYKNFGDIAGDNSSKIVIKMLDALGK